MKKNTIIAATILILIVAGFGIARFNSAKKNQLQNKQQTVKQEEIPLKVSFAKDVLESSFVFNYTKDKGFFDGEGVKVEAIEAIQAPFKLVISGDANLTIGAATRPLAVFFNGVDSRALFNISKSFGQYVISRYDKDHASQIKKVAINAADGGNKEQVVLSLKNLGVDPSKVEYLSGDTMAARIAMLVRGDVDMTQVSDRSVYDNATELNSKLVLFGGDVTEKDSTFVRSVFAMQDDVNKKPEQFQKFTNAFRKALNDIQNNKQSVIEYLKEKYALNDSQADDEYGQFMLAVKDVNFVPTVSDFAASLDGAKKDATNPDRNITDFVQDAFAKKAL